MSKPFDLSRQVSRLGSPSDASGVGRYQEQAVSAIGTLAPTPGFFGNTTPGEGIPVGSGYAHVVRSHIATRIDGSVTNMTGGPAGTATTICVDGISARIGGNGLVAVPEVRSDIGIWDTASPYGVGGNAVTYNARMYVLADGGRPGAVGGTDRTAFFSFAGFTGAEGNKPLGDPGNCTNATLFGMELDVGRTGDGHLGSTNMGRFGLGLYSIGNTLGPVATNDDAAILVASGDQYIHASQTTGGWGAAMAIRRVIGGDAAISRPIAPDGYIITTDGTWGVKTIFNFATVTPSEAILLSPTVDWRPNLLRLYDPNQGIELGNVFTTGAPYIDFHSSGTNHDFDARIITINGTSADAGGDMLLQAGSVTLPQKVGFGIAPTLRAVLPAAATDPATTMALVNAIRTALINKGLTA